MVEMNRLEEGEKTPQETMASCLEVTLGERQFKALNGKGERKMHEPIDL